MNISDKIKLYNEAKAFYEYAECGRIHIPECETVESNIPYIVNMSFCAELLLKLILINNSYSINDVRKFSHNLEELYNALSDEQRESIYQSFKCPMVYSIPEELARIATAFPKWRYLVLDNANRKHDNDAKSKKKERLQYKPLFIKEFNEVLLEICSTLIR